jgi:hypothetical protein
MSKNKNVIKYLSCFFVSGNYSTMTTLYDKNNENEIKKVGVITITDVIDDDGKNIGKKLTAIGINGHMDVCNYDYATATSTHSSVLTNATHTSYIKKANGKMFVKIGHGFSHRNNRNVAFKKVFTKNNHNDGFTIKLYLKSENGSYTLTHKTVCRRVIL